MKQPKEDSDIKKQIYINLCSTPIYRTQLNKLFFFIDALYFHKYKASLTGMDYFKLPYGPVPDGIAKIKFELIENKKIVEFERENIFNSISYFCKVISPEYLKEYEIKNKKAKGVFKTVVERLRTHTVGYLSRLSHIIEPWKSALYGEVLDFNKLPDMSNLLEKKEYLELMKNEQ